MHNTPESKKENPIFGMFKGAVIAIGGVLPGVSGGALCVILGIYQRMMALLCHPVSQIKKQWKFFVPLGVGFVIGTLLASRVIGSFMAAAETPALFLFIGLIIGTLPSLLREAKQHGATRGSYAAMLVSMAAMLLWMIPMSLAGSATVVPSLGWWCLCGVLWGLGIVVPGMSPSNIFLFLGLAAPMYSAIGRLDMGVILPMALCLIATVLGLSRCVDYCLRRFYSVFMHAVVGIVLASTIVILPPVKVLIQPGYTFGVSFGDILIYVLCFAVGAFLAWWLARMERPEER